MVTKEECEAGGFEWVKGYRKDEGTWVLAFSRKTDPNASRKVRISESNILNYVGNIRNGNTI